MTKDTLRQLVDRLDAERVVPKMVPNRRTTTTRLCLGCRKPPDYHLHAEKWLADHPMPAGWSGWTWELDRPWFEAKYLRQFLPPMERCPACDGELVEVVS